jgi:hypothetical protein
MNRGRVGNRQANGADVHADRHGPGALPGAFATEPDKTVPVHLGHLHRAQLTLEHGQRGGLGPAWRLADFRHVGDVEIDQVAEGLQAPDPGGSRGVALVDRPLRVDRSGLGAFLPAEGLTDILIFAPYNGAPGSGRKLHEGGQFRVLYVYSDNRKAWRKSSVTS